MAPLVLTMASVASMLAMLPGTLAGFNPASSKNVAVYWGTQPDRRFVWRQLYLTRSQARTRTTRGAALLLSSV